MAASFFILSFFIINCYAQERTPNDPNFSIQPPSEALVFTYGSTAEFQCVLQSTVSMTVQRIDLVVIDSMKYRGVNTVPDRFGVYCTFTDDIYDIFLPIRENGVGNNTRVRCIAVFPTTSSGVTPEVESQWGTIQIQGPLAAVSNLTAGELIPGQSILLSWVAPFTLDVTNVEPDITYCVDVYVQVDQMTLHHHIRSTCNITATAYNVTFNEGEVTPCDTVNITVIPVNGPPNSIINGTGRSLDHVYLFESLQNFSANGIDILSTEQDHGQVEFNIQLQNSVYMCNTNCSIRASSSSASYELNSGNYLTCHRNVITFTVSNDTGTALPRNDIYSVNIQVSNSAGTGYSVGEINLSTHPIQQVIYASGDDSLQINATFTQNSSARGAQVILKPETLNKSTCSQLAMRNQEKNDDFISTVIDSIHRGTYYIEVYTLNDKGIPESNAKSVISKENRVHFSRNTDSSQTVSTAGNEFDISVSVSDTTATISGYRTRPDGYIAVYLTSRGILLYVIPGNTNTFQVTFSGNDSCLPLFPRHKDSGILLSNTSVNIFITYERNKDIGATTSAAIIPVVVSVILLVILLVVIGVIGGLFCYKCTYHKKKVSPFERQPSAVENIHLERMADNVQLQSTTSLEHRNGDEQSAKQLPRTVSQNSYFSNKSQSSEPAIDNQHFYAEGESRQNGMTGKSEKHNMDISLVLEEYNGEEDASSSIPTLANNCTENEPPKESDSVPVSHDPAEALPVKSQCSLLQGPPSHNTSPEISIEPDTNPGATVEAVSEEMVDGMKDSSLPDSIEDDKSDDSEYISATSNSEPSISGFDQPQSDYSESSLPVKSQVQEDSKLKLEMTAERLLPRRFHEPDDRIIARMEELTSGVKKHIKISPNLILEVMERYNMEEHLGKVPVLADKWKEFTKVLRNFAKDYCVKDFNEYSKRKTKEWPFNKDIKVILILDLTRNMMTRMKNLEDKKGNLFYYDKRSHSDSASLHHAEVPQLIFSADEAKRVKVSVFYKGREIPSASALDGILDLIALHMVHDELPQDSMFALLMYYVFGIQRNSFPHKDPVFSKASSFNALIYDDHKRAGTLL